MADAPDKPGWYWDPDELEFNEEVRQRWRTEGIVSHSPYYRLRWWDGRAWTGERLDTYASQGFIPHLAGPGKLVPAFNEQQAVGRLREVVVLAVILFPVVGIVSWVLVWLLQPR